MNKSFIRAKPVAPRFTKYRLETGFSMLEAVVVVGVLLALAVGGFFAYGPIAENAKRAKVKSSASEVHTGVLVASIDGKSETSPQGVIDAWNASTDKIRTEILGAGTNGDFCVEATNVESPHITAREGDCETVVSAPGQDTDGDGIPDASDPDIDNDGTPNASDPTPNGDVTTPGPTTNPTANDWDGDGIGNAFDASPNAETDFMIAGWGANWSGEIGNGTTDVGVDSPTRTVMQGELAGVRMGLIAPGSSGGFYHSCAVTETNIPYCWGAGDSGQLGTGNKNASPLPAKVDTSGVLNGKFISAISTGGVNSCVIADNSPYCWGGMNATAEQLVPYGIPDPDGNLTGKTLTKIVVGNGGHYCVLASGAPYCWGNSGFGQLGNGTIGDSPAGSWIWKRSDSPVPVDLSGALAGKTITDLTTYGSGYCVIGDGEAFCWGGNYKGILGDGTTTDRPYPVAVMPGKQVSSMTGSGKNACAIADGATYCWGDGGFGGIGNGSTATPAGPTLVDTSGALAGKTVTDVMAGEMHTCVLANDEPYCWGRQGHIGGTGYAFISTPQRVGGLLADQKTVGLWISGGSTFVSYTAK